MRNIIYIFAFVSMLVFSCGTQNKVAIATNETEKEPPVRVANDSIEYEVIIIDPGFGFGKTVAHNLQLVNRLAEFAKLHKPVMMGVSRASAAARERKVCTQKKNPTDRAT